MVQRPGRLDAVGGHFAAVDGLETLVAALRQMLGCPMLTEKSGDDANEGGEPRRF